MDGTDTSGNPGVTRQILYGDGRILRLAREIAADIQTTDTILAKAGVSPDEWEAIQANPTFQRVLQQEIEAWNSAANTEERVKLKAAALIEEWLPELNARIHDPREGLQHKVKAAELARDLAGLGGRGVQTAAVGERFSVTINLGADTPALKIEATPVTPQVTGPVIEGEIVDE